MQVPVKKLLTSRLLIAAAALLAGLVIVFYSEFRPESGQNQQALANIQDIDTLRTQFDLDAGKTRLVILVSPT